MTTPSEQAEARASVDRAEAELASPQNKPTFLTDEAYYKNCYATLQDCNAVLLAVYGQNKGILN